MPCPCLLTNHPVNEDLRGARRAEVKQVARNQLVKTPTLDYGRVVDNHGVVAELAHDGYISIQGALRH